MDDYREIRDMLKPRRDIKASDELRCKVRMVLERERRRRMARRWLFGGVSLGAVAAVLLLVLLPSGLSAKEFLVEAIDALGRSECVEMVVDVRTRPVENFGYIGLDEDFVTHHIYAVRSDSLLMWRVDKGERVATGDGKEIYTWLPALKLGMHIDNADKENVLGYLANLLTPRQILQAELENCMGNDRAEYKMEKKGADVVLTVHAAPQGDFGNPYLLNSSIAESENVRRYVIDAGSKRLKSATVSVVSGSREIVVLKVVSVDYGLRQGEICRLADGIRFVEAENQPGGLKGLSAEEAAGLVLNAFEEWDESVLDKVMTHEMSDAAYREKFRGAKLKSIGRSFMSGMGSSVFVPYTLELRDGTLLRHNISLQKADYGGWIVAGGL